MKLHTRTKTLFTLILSGFIFTHEVMAQSDWDFNLKDLHGTVLITNNVKRYRDTLVFEHPHTNRFRKIPIRNIQSINGRHPDSAGLRNQPYPTEAAALIRLRSGQLVSFWTGLITAGLIAVLPDAMIPVSLGGGGLSTIAFLSSYGGIRKMKKYQKTPVVLKF